MRSCSSPVLVQEAAEQVASTYPALLICHADGGQTDAWVRRFQPKRLVRAMLVVVVDIDPKHLLQVTSPDDEEPVKALGADRADPALGIGVRSGRPDGCEQHLGAFGAEHVVEAAAELRITVAEHEACLSSLLPKHQQQVAGLLGSPTARLDAPSPRPHGPVGCPVR